MGKYKKTKAKFCSSDEKRVMKNMKTEAKTLFKGLKKGNGKHENGITTMFKRLLL